MEQIVHKICVQTHSPHLH